LPVVNIGQGGVVGNGRSERFQFMAKMEEEFHFGFLFKGIAGKLFNGPQNFTDTLLDVKIAIGIDQFKLFIHLSLDRFNITCFVVRFEQQIGEQFLVFLFEFG
jgi:hypothetical protein